MAAAGPVISKSDQGPISILYVYWGWSWAHPINGGRYRMHRYDIYIVSIPFFALCYIYLSDIYLGWTVRITVANPYPIHAKDIWSLVRYINNDLGTAIMMELLLSKESFGLQCI